jgi:hypothetical protein
MMMGGTQRQKFLHYYREAFLESLAKLNLRQASSPESPPHWPFGTGKPCGGAAHYHPAGDGPEPNPRMTL